MATCTASGRQLCALSFCVRTVRLCDGGKDGDNASAVLSRMGRAFPREFTRQPCEVVFCAREAKPLMPSCIAEGQLHGAQAAPDQILKKLRLNVSSSEDLIDMPSITLCLSGLPATMVSATAQAFLRNSRFKRNGAQPTNKRSTTALRKERSTGCCYGAQAGCGPERFFKKRVSHRARVA